MKVLVAAFACAAGVVICPPAARACEPETTCGGQFCGEPPASTVLRASVVDVIETPNYAVKARLHIEELFGAATNLDFVMHRPEAVIDALTAAGFTLEARLDRAPYPGVEHPSQRTYLLARK